MAPSKRMGRVEEPTKDKAAPRAGASGAVISQSGRGEKPLSSGDRKSPLTATVVLSWGTQPV